MKVDAALLAAVRSALYRAPPGLAPLAVWRPVDALRALV